MKRVYVTTIAVALLALAAFAAIYTVWERTPERGVVKVGFIYDSDESTPYTYNFVLAENALERAMQDGVKVYTRSNIPEGETAEPVRELVRAGCDIIFTNNYSPQFEEVAREFPEVQFCQSSFNAGDHADYPKNFHTFNGEIYQARYVSGVVAGCKLRELIDGGRIAADAALVGYVGAYPSVEVISGYTAFLLGVRSVAPEATMRVRYTHAWSSYNKEKACARQLIDEGCVVICQHTDTIGPAMACEEASEGREVYHVGYNQSMVDIAPGTSLVSARVNWAPYVISAVQAVKAHEDIEKQVVADISGNDARAGFDQDWVQVLDLNRQIAAYGTEEKVEKAVDALERGTLQVFKGDYVGVNPDDPADTIDLKNGFKENDGHSWPEFHYVLKDVITIEE